MSSHARRLSAAALQTADKHWAEAFVDHILESQPDKDLYTCAAGISPSGIVHFGNFRDVMTSYAVGRALEERGKKVRYLFSWDEFDRFRKVPQGVDAAWIEHIGKPLTAVPDPFGCHESYARHWQVEFEEAIQEIGIPLDYRYQAKKYTNGDYDDLIIKAMRERERIARTLLSFMSDKGKTEKEINEEEYVREYYPISVYSRFTGKDNTVVTAYDGNSTITYTCLDTKQSETIDFTKEHIVKLAWKIDWPMRWGVEGVVFEPGGHDHASPGGSYDVSSTIAKEIFDIQPPLFVGYQFVGIQGTNGKMSGSKGNAIAPKQLLEIYEPALLKWLYLRKLPDQAFSLAFDSEIIRQYDELDREGVAQKDKTLSLMREKALRYSLAPQETLPASPIPFRQAVGYGQILNWNEQKVTELLGALDLHYDTSSVTARLSKAKAWLETYNPDQLIRLREEINQEYVATMDEEAKQRVRSLREALQTDGFTEIPKLEELVYRIPKDESLTQEENSPRQRAFFKDIYRLLINADTGPRLSTFLWAIDRERVLQLLDI